ncbi:MAG: response regulator, partial [Ignavibacteriae bacterium]|nr:response regulator [Ignavibacteriota bacterium]
MELTSSTSTVERSLPTSKQLRVLLVDDIMENLSLLEEVLTDQGYGTASVTSGAEALERLNAELFHLVVADAMMPSIDGFQLCKVMKQSPGLASIPFIIYTGNYVDVEDQMFAKSIGVDAYVMKYDGLSTLVQAVNTLARKTYGAAGGHDDLADVQQMAAETSSQLALLDEQMFLERHHAIIVKKLEEKMHELEMYAETLARKNREIQASEARYRNLF